MADSINEDDHSEPFTDTSSPFKVEESVTLNEVIEQEKESLLMIFPEEFSTPSYYEFVFTLKPKSLAVPTIIIFNLPPNYPNEPPTVSINNIGRKTLSSYSEEMIKTIEISIAATARLRVGNTMMFELIEEVRTRLEEVKDDLALGHLACLSNDVLSFILTLCQPNDLIRVTRVCQVLHRLSDDNRVWATVTRSKIPEQLHDSAKEMGWKRCYFQRVMGRIHVAAGATQVKLMDWMCPVYDRIRLPNAWPSDPPITSLIHPVHQPEPWMHYFMVELKEYGYRFEFWPPGHQVTHSLLPDRSGEIYLTQFTHKVIVGTFRLYTWKELTQCLTTRVSGWFTNTYNPSECPYLGQCFGIITFTVTEQHYFKPLVTNICATAKGNLIRQGKPTLPVVSCGQFEVKANFTRRVEQVLFHPGSVSSYPKAKDKQKEKDINPDEDSSTIPKRKVAAYYISKTMYSPTKAMLSPMRSQNKLRLVSFAGHLELLAPLLANCKYSSDLRHSLAKKKKDNPNAETFVMEDLWVLALPSSETLDRYQ